MSDKPPPSKPTSWSKEEQTILRTQLDLWKDKEGAVKPYASAAYRAIRDGRSNLTDEDKNDLWTSVCHWMSNHHRDRRKYRRNTKQTARTMVFHENMDTIFKIMKDDEEIAKAPPKADVNPQVTEEIKKQADMPFIGRLQCALSKHMATLDDSEILEAEKRAHKRNEEGPPPDVQLKNAQKKAGKVISEFANDLHRDFGMIALVLTVYKKEDGQLVAGLHEQNKRAHGSSFERSHPEWQKEPILPLLKKFAMQAFGLVPAEEAVEGKSSNIAITIPVDDHGMPQLPAEPPNRRWNRDELIFVIREFITLLYRIASGKPNGAAPWLQMTARLAEFIASEYLPRPDVLAFKEPSKYNEVELRVLYDFLYARQCDPSVEHTLRFHGYLVGRGSTAQVLPVHMKGDPSPPPAPKRTKKKGSRRRTTTRATQAISPRPDERSDSDGGDDRARSQPPTLRLRPATTKSWDVRVAGEESEASGSDYEETVGIKGKDVQAKNEEVDSKAATKVTSKTASTSPGSTEVPLQTLPAIITEHAPEASTSSGGGNHTARPKSTRQVRAPMAPDGTSYAIHGKPKSHVHESGATTNSGNIIKAGDVMTGEKRKLENDGINSKGKKSKVE